MAIIKELRGISPQWGTNCFFAENSVIVGEVTMGNNCSIWFSAVIRGDVHSISIGDNTNVQDGAVIHCTYKTARTVIGNNVSIGHNAIVHGCTIEDNVLVGMGAIVMDHAHIGSGSVIAAGAVVLPKTIVEERSVYAGIPAQKVKNVGKELNEVIRRTPGNYIKYSEWYK